MFGAFYRPFLDVGPVGFLSPEGVSVALRSEMLIVPILDDNLKKISNFAGKKNKDIDQ